jgi:hypothetical protein
MSTVYIKKELRDVEVGEHPIFLFPENLIHFAWEARMKIPTSDVRDYNPREYPHWDAFCRWQIGREIPTAHTPHVNAEIIAKLDADRAFDITSTELKQLGCV